MNLKARADQLKKDVPAVFISLRRQDTPLIAKIFAGMTLVYALSPIDLIPDFIPIFGLLDDVILLPFLIAVTIKLIPKDVFEQCRKEAETIWLKGKPKKWIYAIPFVLIWFLMLYFIVKVFFTS